MRNLRELVDLIETGSDPFVILKNKWGHQIVLDRARVAAAQAQILATYRIPEDRSADLRKNEKAGQVL